MGIWDSLHRIVGKRTTRKRQPSHSKPKAAGQLRSLRNRGLRLEQFEDRVLLTVSPPTSPDVPVNDGFTALDEYLLTAVGYVEPTAPATTLTGTGYKDYVYDFVSQVWTPGDGSITVTTGTGEWHHWLHVVVPDDLDTSLDTAFLFIDGGSISSTVPTTTKDVVVDMALATHSICIDLRTVPNEPLTFTDEPYNHTEDEIVAYTFDKFLETYDTSVSVAESWPSYLPMVNSAVRAMDAIQALVPGLTSDAVEIDGFVVSGASKRGWTTELTTAVDGRVKAMIPLVADLPNLVKQMEHQADFYAGLTWGYVEDSAGNRYSQELYDYLSYTDAPGNAAGGLTVIERMNTPIGGELLAIVDPFAYRDRETMDVPKYFVCGAGDEFFVPGSAEYYIHGLQAEDHDGVGSDGSTYLSYVPNIGHNIDSSPQAVQSVTNFYAAVLAGDTLPTYDWTIEDGGNTIRLNTPDTPTQVLLWQATNPSETDFRLYGSTTPYWSSTTLAGTGGEYVAHVSTPASGATAFMIEVHYNVGGKELIFSTSVSVVSPEPVSPELVSVIPDAGGVVEDGDTLHIAPRELILQFNEGQQLSSATLDAIKLYREGDANPITLGYVGIGDYSNQVVIRFTESLTDGDYRLVIEGAGADALTNVQGIAFHEGQNLEINFELNLAPTIVAVVPQPIVRDGSTLQQQRKVIQVYFNDDPLDLASAQNTAFYQLIATNDTATTADDGTPYTPESAVYSQEDNMVTLVFADDLAVYAAGGALRLRIGDPYGAITTTRINTVTDAGSSFAEATPLADMGSLAESRIISATIQSDPSEFYYLEYPGALDEPGERDLPDAFAYTWWSNLQEDPEDHYVGGQDNPDSDPLITTIYYNFADVIGFNVSGLPLYNLITDAQMDRAREVFELYGHYLGVQFVETASTTVPGYYDIQVARGDIKALANTSAPGGHPAVWNVSGQQGLALMDAAENWGTSEFGGDFMAITMQTIGLCLGLGYTFDLPAGSVMGSLNYADSTEAEPVYPGNYDIIHGQYLYRPDDVDIDLYEFEVQEAGMFSAEIFAERMDDSSLLDSVVTLYKVSQENPGEYEIVARNDDYFSNDSFLELHLDPGTYYIGVSASGNIDYDPNIYNSGIGGVTQGDYELRLNFVPGGVDSNDVSTFLASRGQYLVDAEPDTDVNPAADGVCLDGDADGVPGGIFNFWFNTQVDSYAAFPTITPLDRPSPEVQPFPLTIYVDKLASATGANGTLAHPFKYIDDALAVSQPGDVVRIIGNNSANDAVNMLDNVPYQIGVDRYNNPLEDGRTLEVPRGVTVMIDAGALLKLRGANIDVGSSAEGIDRSGGSLQILGTPSESVHFTSYYDDTMGGNTDHDGVGRVARAGDWGGLVFRNELDYDFIAGYDPAGGEAPRQVLETEGIFLNYVNHADITFGGGAVNVDGMTAAYAPIYLVESRPTISYNNIHGNADSAISADPDSFEETIFEDWDGLTPFTSDYSRVGPDIRGNTVTGNSINGLFVRVRTAPGEPIHELDVAGRFDDWDIVHVISEVLFINGTPGGPVESNGLLEARLDASLVIDPGVIVKMDASRIEIEIGAQLIAEGRATTDGAPGYPVVFTSLYDDRYGAGGVFQTNASSSDRDAIPGDWGGLIFNPTSRGSIDEAVIAFAGSTTAIEGDFAGFDPVEIRQAIVRITNSHFEDNNGTGSTDDRGGHGEVTPATIFIRGAQPILVGNDFIVHTAYASQVVSSPPICIDVNSLSSALVSDWGRSTGTLSAYDEYLGNAGPMVRANRMENNGINGMLIRAGILTTESVWDDTDIVHVLGEKVTTVTTSKSLDLLLLEDLTGSFGDDIETVSTLVTDLVNQVRAIEPTTRFGLASFMDKPIGSFGSSGYDYVYETNLALTSLPTPLPADNALQTAVDALVLGAGADGPEAQIEALMQAALRTTEVGYRSDALHVVVLFTDANYHVAGDGASEGITTANNGDTVLDGDPAGTGEDYPSVDQLRTALIAASIIPVFAVTEFATDYYTDLVDQLGFGTVVELTSDSSNLVEAVTSALEDVVVTEPTEEDYEVTVTNYEHGGGLRIQSSPTASLVVKLFGENSGFTAGGDPLEIDDRIGGTIQILGTAEHPVVLTALTDDTVGAGYDLNNQPLLDTNNDGSLTTPVAGSWRSVRLEAYSNDRNVLVVNELEVDTGATQDVNNVPLKAQVLGQLAQSEMAGDDHLRLGFDIHGSIRYDAPDDVDVYAFQATAGTEIWLDIDNTSFSLDSVVELIDATGRVLARSDNSLAEAMAVTDQTTGESPLLYKQTPVQFVRVMDNDDWIRSTSDGNLTVGYDVYSTNPRDAGMRLVLPGTAGSVRTYYVRVRSSSSQISDVTAGETKGDYQLQIRLGEDQEVAGSAIFYADIRYASTGIEILGLPDHSPLIGETAEVEASGTTGDNDTFDTAQDVGNLLETSQSTLSWRGYLTNADDVDWYKLTLNVQGVNPLFDSGRVFATIFDLDYADGMGRADLTMWVFDSNGHLVLMGTDSNITDDQPSPLDGADVDDLSRGSVGPLDPFIGSVYLPEQATYYVAITSALAFPTALDPLANPYTRVEPIDSIARIIEDHVETTTIPDGYGNSSQYYLQPEPTELLLGLQPVAAALGDVTTFAAAGRTLYSINPSTGQIELTTGTDSLAEAYIELAMRNDTRLYSISDPEADDQVDFNLIDPEDPTQTLSSSTITLASYQTDVDNPGDIITVDDGTITVTAMAHGPNNDYRHVFIVTQSHGDATGSLQSNILWVLEEDGNPVSHPTLNAIPLALLTGTNVGTITGLSFIGNTLYAIDDRGRIFRADGIYDGDFANSSGGWGFVEDPDVAGNLVPLVGVGGMSLVADLESAILGSGSPNYITGFVAGPASADSGAYANMVFITTNTGRIYAADVTTGTLQPVFNGGSTYANTGIGGLNAIAFTAIDFNLWHVTEHRSLDTGHGINTTFNYTRPNVTGNYDYPKPGYQSWYFGIDDPRLASDRWDGPVSATYNLALSNLYDNSDAADSLFYTYNLPGGVYGSLESRSFSLEGYERFDEPTLYFNYYANTQGGDKYDTFRVFISSNGGSWQLLATNNDWGTYDSRLAAPGRLDTYYLEKLYDNGDGDSLWRQVRVDLGTWAGSGDLKLRFEFSTFPASSLNTSSLTDTLGIVDNQHEGIYIDDIIIGFAERGEIVTAAPAATTDFAITSMGELWGQPLVRSGSYQIEVRRGADYAFGGAGHRVTDLGGYSDQYNPFGQYDTNDRLAEAITIYTQAANVLVHGDTFRINDGIHTETYILWNSTLPGTPGAGQTPVYYDPSWSAAQVAQSLASAINASSVTKVTGKAVFDRVDLFDAVRVDMPDVSASGLGLQQKVWGLDSPDGYDVGDSNTERVKGQIVVENNIISQSSGYGIVVAPDARDNNNADLPHPGSGRAVNVTNDLVTGITIQNNIISGNSSGGIRISGQADSSTDAIGAVPFVRVVNNTISGAILTATGAINTRGTGINVQNNASPTILNNIVAYLKTGIQVDSSSASTVLGANIYKNNNTNVSGTSLGTLDIQLGEEEPLFVDVASGNFYLAPGSKAVDSVINSLEERQGFYNEVLEPMGIPVSPIVAPDHDYYGHLRLDDPDVAWDTGQGQLVFKDRGAIDRVDFDSPEAALVSPVDNGADDRNPEANDVIIIGTLLTEFEIQLSDFGGVGIDDSTVTSNSVVVYRGEELLIAGKDYFFHYDAAADLITLVPSAGVWAQGFDYNVVLLRDQIFDLGRNPLLPNREDNTTHFIIGLSGLDFGDAPDPTFPTRLENDGARHLVKTGFYLGTGINGESDAKPADQYDDGVSFQTYVLIDSTMEMTVKASTAGYLNAWIDFNGNGTWESGEHLFGGVAQYLTAGDNLLTFVVPDGLTPGEVWSRFRFSSVETLGTTGEAPDGEVEDYLLQLVDHLEDFGDAPVFVNGELTGYQTVLPDAARHAIVSNLFLGTTVAPDGEMNGQPTILANGDDANRTDDEDGVNFYAYDAIFSPDQRVTIAVDASEAGGYLSMWFDFNGDYDWDDLGEHVVLSANGETDFSVPLNAGRNEVSFDVPESAEIGVTYVRFRLSTERNLESFGSAPDGEVEDYAIEIIDTPLDFGDAPSPYPTVLADDGARHIYDPNVHLGATIDYESNGLPRSDAKGDDADASDDEDGVWQINPSNASDLQQFGTYSLIAGQNNTIVVVASTAGYLNAWLDINGDRDWNDSAEHIFISQPLQAGENELTFSLPRELNTVSTYARFRFTSSLISGLGVTGGAPDGEVEDYAVSIVAGGSSISGYAYDDLNNSGSWDGNTWTTIPTIAFATPGSTILAAGNDNSSLAMNLGFSFEFYGHTYTQMYVNNNGTVTFGAPSGTYDADGFYQDLPMLAPFWADVDTRATGQVRMVQGTSTRGNPYVQVDWVDVGYYTLHSDKTDSFRLYIENDAAGDIVVFSYDDMQWTTGDGTGGSGGFGGQGAQIGFDAGDHVHFANLGRPSTVEEVQALNGTQYGFRFDPTTGLPIGNEPGMSGILVHLGDATGAPVLDINGTPITAVTDADGYYNFGYLFPGTYTVWQTVPYGRTQTRPLTGLTLLNGAVGQADGSYLVAVGLSDQLHDVDLGSYTIAQVSISGVSVLEGNSGTTEAHITLHLTDSFGAPVTVYYSTANGTATIANNDYVSVSDGSFTFIPQEAPIGVWSTPTTITNNKVNDYDYSVYGDYIVWENGGGIVFLYDDSTGLTTTLTVAGSDDRYPVIHGTHVVYESKPAGESDYEIYLYDIVSHTRTRLTDNAVDDLDPQLSDSHVVWSSAGTSGGEIYLYNLSTPGLPVNAAVNISNNSLNDFLPKIAGSRVVWTTYDGSDNEIWYYDGTKHQLSNNSRNDANPVISDLGLVWEMYDGHDLELMAYAFGTSSPVQLTNNTTNDQHAAISGTRLVWEGSDGSDSEVFSYDLATSTSIENISNNTTIDERPQLLGNRLVWHSYNGSNWEVYYKEIGSLTPVTNISNSTAYDWHPQISESFVAWRAYQNGNYEIVLSKQAKPEVTAEIVFTINGDTSAESDEYFIVNVTGASSPTQLLDDSGNVQSQIQTRVGILNDDGSMDFGDAPAPYPTLLADNGARHLNSGGYYLGASVDVEANGKPSATATGDDYSTSDDEDGVTFNTTLTPGVVAQVSVVASKPGVLNAWLDFNGDGDWNDLGEQIFVDRTLTQGANLLTFSVPFGIDPVSTFARFRFSQSAGLSYTGTAATGEVEDYQVSIVADPNLVGRALTINGTTGDDQFEFTAGSVYRVMVNGTTYLYPATAIDTVQINGLGGNDTAVLHGSAGTENVRMWAGKARFMATGLDLWAYAETISVTSGGGDDTVRFLDSAGKDVVTAAYQSASMVGDGYSNSATGFYYMLANSINGGADEAYLYDSPGRDTLTATPTQAIFTGPGMSSSVFGFKSVVANSTANIDTSWFYDSPGNDVFTTTPTRVTMVGTGYSLTANNFQNAHGLATAGGTDNAYMYDSAGDDIYRADGAQGRMFGPDFFIRARYFDNYFTYSLAGGHDVAIIKGTAGKDTFYATPTLTRLYGSGYYHRVVQYDDVSMYGLGGVNTADLSDSAGDDYLEASGTSVKLTGIDIPYSLLVDGCDPVKANSSNIGDKKHSTVAFLLATGQWEDI